MVESGSFPNAESDDPLAVNPVAPKDVDDDLDAEEFDDDTEAPTGAGADDELENQPTAPGGFDKVRAAAFSTARWCLERAGAAASQGATVVASYPRAALATGLSTLVLAGVLTFSPGKKAPTVQVPNPETPAASQAGTDAKADSDAPKPGGEPPAEPPDAPLLADASKPPIVDDAPAPAPDPAVEPAARVEKQTDAWKPPAVDPEPTPTIEPVKLAAGTDDAGLPELPVVEHDPIAPPSGGETALPSPVPAPAAVAAGGLGAATGLAGMELAKADVKPGESAVDVVPAPASAADPTTTPEPAIAPDPVAVPDPAKTTEPAPSPEPKPTPEPATAPEPAPIKPATTPEPSPVSDPAPALVPETAPAPATAPEPVAAAPTPPVATDLPLAAPATVGGLGTAAKGALGALGLGAGLGAAAAALSEGSENKPAEPSPPARPAAPGVSVESPRSMVPEPTPPPSAPPLTVETPAPAPAQPPTSAPESLPPFQEVPAPALGSVEAPPPTVEPRTDPAPMPRAATEHPDWKPLRRSGDLGAGGFDRAEPRIDDRFSRGDEDPGDANRFDLETFPSPGQTVGRAGGAAAATTAASVQPRPAAGKIDTVLHKVESGENFYTIAQSYYSSGRYYRALAFANSDKFKRPEDLFVGAVIRIPPPEDLNPAYIDPPGTRYTSKSQSSRSPKTAAAASKPTAPIQRARRTEIELDSPSSDQAAGADLGRDRYEPEAASRRVSTRPVHKVQPDETLRTIARDRLGSARRAGEILELNRDAVNDPSDLVVGQILELPDDARTARYQGSR